MPSLIYMNKVSYCLSSDDIYKFFNNQIKILTYKEIDKYDNIDQLLFPYNRVMILFEKEPRKGHWCCLFKNKKNETYFYDSYAIKPPNQLKYSAGQNRYLKQKRDTLLRIFENHLIKYNPVGLQKWAKGINTCGRWCLARMACDELNSYEFAELIKSQTDDPDKFITNVTNKFLLH